MQTLQIRRWFDRHLHLRDGDMMADVLPCTLSQRATGALVMPNLIPDPVITVDRAFAYRQRIRSLLPPGSDFEPVMTCYLTDHTTPQMVEDGFRQGVWRAAKLYMADKNGQGGTTGSAHGVRDLIGLYPVFRKMQEIGMPLLGHFEAVEPDVDEFDREKDSLERDLKPLRREFPELIIVAEHVTTAELADFVDAAPGPTFATLTPQHIRHNRNKLFAGGMNPIAWCKPVLKRSRHMERVRGYATQGHQRFGAGTDSAPHVEAKKAVCCGCAAGVFSAPLAAELYLMTFLEDGRAENLERFMSENLLREVYGVEPSEERMTFVRRERVVPERVGSVRVFAGGETLPWTLLAD